MVLNQKFKNIVKSGFEMLHIDLTKNMQYDRLTKIIMKQELNPYANCLDIGCHAGEMLDIMLEFAPHGKHLGFEPIPYLYEKLQDKYGSHTAIHRVALSNNNGETEFNVVKNAPAFSGLKKRAYQVSNPDIEKIKVTTQKLDDLLPENAKVDFVKIDVEGAEYDVLLGGLETFKRCQPTLIFEFGLGASDFYGTTPEQIFDLIVNQIGLKIYTLENFIANDAPLSLEALKDVYAENSEYYFVAKA